MLLPKKWETPNKETKSYDVRKLHIRPEANQVK
jgi:hypothetical protein